MASPSLNSLLPAARNPARPVRSIVSWIACILALIGLLTPAARAELQFDVFLGYDNFVREAAWYPLTCEVYNDGPGFDAAIEISSSSYSGDHVRRVPVELPTGTRKRIVIPMFGANARFSQHVRLVDARGREVAKRENLSPRHLVWEGILLGAMPRTFAGTPALPEINKQRPEINPQVAKMQVEAFPDNPIALEGLSAIYLNSEKAVALKVPQVNALLSWLNNGGHVIVAVEQISDVNATPWLQQLLPYDLAGMVNVRVDEPLADWVRSGVPAQAPAPVATTPGRNRPRTTSTVNPYLSAAPDPAFTGAEAAVATGTSRDGVALVSAGNNPLVIEARRGRGTLTLLTFSPEREPFKSWKQRPWFWARLVNVPQESLRTDFNQFGGWSLDGVFGSLLDSRQIRKLPVEWLLLLLLVYLVVIGPFDHYVLKRINRQMLTWITFPAYVVFFSVLIYFIGYKLRAGETEWNELTVIDVLPRGERAEFRGRTYVSIYSSANARFPLAAEQPFATLRGEFVDVFGGRESSRGVVEQIGNSFRGEVSVPVWTSQLFVSDWQQPATMPFKVSTSPTATGWSVSVENLTEKPLTETRIVIEGAVFELGNLPPRQTSTVQLNKSQGVVLRSFVQQNGGDYQAKADQRRQAFSDNRGRLEGAGLVTAVASFISELSPRHERQRGCIFPPGFDLSEVASRGDTILLGLIENHSLVKPIRQFNPPRNHQSTFLRLVIPSGVTRKG